MKRPGKPLRFPRNVLKLDGYCGIHCPPTSIIDPDIQTKVETETERQGDGERLTLKDTQERERGIDKYRERYSQGGAETQGDTQSKTQED